MDEGQTTQAASGTTPTPFSPLGIAPAATSIAVDAAAAAAPGIPALIEQLEEKIAEKVAAMPRVSIVPADETVTFTLDGKPGLATRIDELERIAQFSAPPATTQADSLLQSLADRVDSLEARLEVIGKKLQHHGIEGP